jgi:hypothetical protein
MSQVTFKLAHRNSGQVFYDFRHQLSPGLLAQLRAKLTQYGCRGDQGKVVEPLFVTGPVQGRRHNLDEMPISRSPRATADVRGAPGRGLA